MFPAVKNTENSFTYDTYSPDGTPHHSNLATVRCKGKYVCGIVEDYNTQTAQQPIYIQRLLSHASYVRS